MDSVADTMDVLTEMERASRDWIAGPYADALAGRGYQLWLYGDLEAAEEALGEALGVNPFHSRALGLMGITLTYRGRREAALAAGAEAVRRNTAAALGFTARGAARALTGEVAEGAEDCEYGLALEPESPLGNYFSACCWARKGHEDICRERLARAIAVERRLRDCALTEGSFRRYWDKPWFKELTG
jgi:tetratricopeptide (TPR) repeat protein